MRYGYRCKETRTYVCSARPATVWTWVILALLCMTCTDNETDGERDIPVLDTATDSSQEADALDFPGPGTDAEDPAPDVAEDVVDQVLDGMDAEEEEVDIGPHQDIVIRYDGVIGDHWRVGAYLGFPGSDLQIDWVSEYASRSFTSSPTTLSIPVPPLEDCRLVDIGGERPRAFFYVFAYADEDLDNEFNEEPVVGFADRFVMFVYEGAASDLATWYVVSISLGQPGLSFHPIAQGFDLDGLMVFRSLGVSGTVQSSNSPPDSTPPEPPNRLATVSMYEGEGGTRLPGRPLEMAINCTPPCSFSFTLDAPLHAERVRLSEELSLPLGVEIPIAYEDVAPDGLLTEMDRIESMMCLETHRVAFEYIGTITDLSGAFIVNLLGFRHGWNAILLPDQPGDGPIPLAGDSLTGLVFDDVSCPFQPGE